MRSLCIIHVTLIVLGVAASCGAHAANHVFVDANDPTCRGRGVPGHSCFDTIQEGVDNAGPRAARVTVFPGTYPESVDLSTMGSAIGRTPTDIILKSANRLARPRIEPPAGDAPIGRAFYTSSPGFPGNVRIDGFRVTSAENRDAINLDAIAGSVTIERVVATHAFFDGVDVEAEGDIACIDSEASDNGNDGFQLSAGGDVLVDGCRADRNGPDLDPRDPAIDELPDNDFDDDGIQIMAGTGTVVIKDSFADGNAGDGFDIEPGTADGGAINVEVIRSTTTRNVDDGLDLDMGDDPAQGLVLDVELRHVRSHGNGSNGMQIQADGEMRLHHIEASDNGRLDITSDGIGIGDDGDVPGTGNPSLLDMSYIVATDNVGEGIDAHVDGDISLAECDVSRNGTPARGADSSDDKDGIQLDTTPGSDGGVTIDRCVANDNSSEGINIDGIHGPALLSRITANRNGFSRFDGSPDAAEGIQVKVDSGDRISIVDCVANRNSDDGVSTETGGAILIEDCEASYNGSETDDPNDREGNGFSVRGGEDPPDESLPDRVTMRRVVADGNLDDGLDLPAEGPITLDRVCAEGNGEDGIFIKQATALRISNSDVRNNGDTGLFMQGLIGGTNTVTRSNFVGNVRGVLLNSNVEVNAGRNWWGAITGPSAPLDVDPVADSAIDMVTPFTDATFGTFGMGILDIDPFRDLPRDVESDLSDDLPPEHICDQLRRASRS